ncbi:type II secretion system minor pseudopilin GspK [Rheinheimera sp. 4Y26]|uniref:type II secretion system minor pseudopilin GspK n=1 Tax=Rheinheimera sp. 4Y26 TaxID=2977811 RepID=UPI0021B0EA85|nr:type II secretion system minor pseudopilin GspK [Rheinheimera sp. 4Y26]MCT6701284.1 type II secretion system minor pseudopilin GspK [Rheinheimera sp. 4Y26]
MMARLNTQPGIMIKRSSLRRQSGVALIAVMMVVALVVVIAVSMSGRLQLQLQRQLNLMERQQALWLALGAEEFSRQLLKTSVAGKETVNLSQPWAAEAATFPVEQGSISGKITDLQGCFNLNALQLPAKNGSGQNGQNSDAERNRDGEQNRNSEQNTNGEGQNSAADNNPEQNRNNQQLAARNNRTGQQATPAQQAMQRLLEQSASDLSMPAEYLVARLTDWLDADNQLQSAGGAEENDYAALEFPYYSANSLMVSKSELRQILDVTPADYALVAPLVCVIPQQSLLQLNVNTLTEAQAAVLAGMIPGLALDDAQALIAGRPEKGFDSLDQFWASSQLSGLAIPDDVKTMFSVKSRFFQAELTVQLADSSFKLTSVFKVDDNQAVQVVARRFGGPG